MLSVKFQGILYIFSNFVSILAGESSGMASTSTLEKEGVKQEVADLETTKLLQVGLILEVSSQFWLTVMHAMVCRTEEGEVEPVCSLR